MELTMAVIMEMMILDDYYYVHMQSLRMDLLLIRLARRLCETQS